MKRTARSLEAAPADLLCFRQLAKTFVTSSLTRCYSIGTVFQHWRTTFKHPSFKTKLRMQVNDQHRTKLLFSSKLCQLYIQSYQPAIRAKPLLANPAASDQLISWSAHRRIMHSVSFGTNSTAVHISIGDTQRNIAESGGAAQVPRRTKYS